MKKFVLLMAGLATACAASADWGTTLEDPVKLFPTGTASYATDVRPAPDGSVWSLIYYPNVQDAQDEFDTKHVIYEYRLQHYDVNGNPEFPELGLLVSDYENKSFTTVNDLLLVDSEGNAVVAVLDHRNSNDGYESFTAYKISPEGEFLWGEEGVPVSDPLVPMGMGAWMKMIELEDHSIVFAWMDCFSEDNASYVRMQRISKDGEPQWDLEKVAMTDEVTGYPFLVNSGNNTFILVYGRSASSILYARKLDFECESVWGKDVRIYRGGWGTIPLQVILDVKSSGDGGALICWTDDRSGTQVEWPYMSYVTPDGELGFAGQSDESDVKLSYEEGWRAFQVDVCPAADGSCFYAVWRRTNPNQNMQGVMGQKVSKTGELLWGDNGVAIEPIKNSTYGYVSIQPAGENGACAFYEEYRSYHDQQCMAMRFDGDGNPVWDSEVILLSEENRGSSDLYSQTMGKTGEWLLNWCDGGSDAEDDQEETYLMTRFNQDGTFGLSANSVNSVEAEAGSATFDGEALRGNVADGTAVSVYTVDGKLAAEYEFAGGAVAVNLPAGLYIAEIQGGNAVKFVVK